MSKIVIFGAGGQAGRRAVAEAARRGHLVTAVARDPGKHADLASDVVTVVTGDVTDAESVAALAADCDAAINAAARLDVSAVEFYVSATHALLTGLATADVGRLIAVGIGTTLHTVPGIMLHDTPGFPAEGKAFSLGHAAELEILRTTQTALDWVVVTPPPVMLDDASPRTGRYRIGTDELMAADESMPPFSYADLAVALVDQIEEPTHHRTQLAVGY
jgi:uncharacterized protein